MMTTPTTRSVYVPARNDANRAPIFLITAREHLSVDFRVAGMIVDQALDCDRAYELDSVHINPNVADLLLLLAQSSFTSDDDFDDFRAEIDFFVQPALEFIRTWGPDAIDPSAFDPDLVRRVNDLR